MQFINKTAKVSSSPIVIIKTTSPITFEGVAIKLGFPHTVLSAVPYDDKSGRGGTLRGRVLELITYRLAVLYFSDFLAISKKGSMIYGPSRDEGLVL